MSNMSEHPSLNSAPKKLLEQLGQDTNLIVSSFNTLQETLHNVNTAFESLDALKILADVQQEIHGFTMKYTEVLTVLAQNSQAESELIASLRDKASKL
jgi:hypothetical protein